MNINFHVSRLTIEGMSRAEGLRVGEALKTHLTDLARAGMPVRGAKIDRLNAGILSPGASAESIGRHLASQIFRNLKGRRDG